MQKNLNESRWSINSEIKETIESQSLEQDILSLLSAAMPLRTDIPGFNRDLYGHILKDKVTKDPVHDMLFNTILATYTEIMLKLHYVRLEEEAMLCPYLERPAEPAYTPSSGYTELLMAFAKLVETHAKHFRGDALNVMSRTDPEGNTNH